MPFNLSGVFSLAQPAFVAGTVISSAAVNSDLSDIAAGLTTVWGMADTASTSADASASLLENLVINGGMEVSQEFGTTAQTGITAVSSYYLDMFGGTMAGTGVCTIQQVDDAPTGYARLLKKSLKKSITTADAVLAVTDKYTIGTFIEGYRAQRLQWGTANAQALTVGFFIKANRTGTYGFGLSNSAGNRAYPHAFTVNASDTWEFKTFTLPGDTAGVWTTDNTAGVWLTWVMAAGTNFTGVADTWAAGTGVGVNGQTNGVAAVTDYWNITGVVAVPGTVTLTGDLLPAYIRPFNEEMVFCKRYWEKSYNYAVAPGSVATAAPEVFLAGLPNAAYTPGIYIHYKVRKRSDTAAITLYSTATGASGKIRNLNAAADVNAAAASSSNEYGFLGSPAAGLVAATTINIAFEFVSDARL